ncbi:MAG: tetratricopeptide (TPR) repeat protein, partial [Phenylobacterium sp.]
MIICFHHFQHNKASQWARYWPFVLVFLCYFIASPTHASTQNLSIEQTIEQYQGIVGDVDAYRFILSPSESMLIEVTQANSDVKLVLYDVATEKTLVFAASIPATSWVNESIVVNASQCSSCLLQIQPVAKVDESGSYQLTSTRLMMPQDNAKIKFASIMTTAAIQWLTAGEDRAQLTPVYRLYFKVSQLAQSEAFKRRSVYLAAEVSHLLGNYNTQRELLLTLIAAKSNDALRLRALVDLGVSDQENRQFEQAMDYFEQALAISQGDDLMRAKITSRLGIMADSQGEHKQAEVHFSEAFVVFLASGDWPNTILGLINLGWSNYRHGDLAKALKYYHQALSFAIKTGSAGLKVNALTKIGNVYGRMGDIDQAIHFIDLALLDSGQFSHSLLDGRAKQAKATVLFRAGMFELAKDVYQQARIAYAKEDSLTDEINIHYFLGRVHNGLGNYAQAQQNYLKVLAFDKKAANNYDIGTGYNRLAETALAQQHYAQALDYQNQALTLLKDVDDDHLKGRLYSQAGMVYFYNDLAAQSQDYFQRAQQLQQHNDDYFGSIDTGYRMAITKADAGDKKPAVAILSAVINKIQSQDALITRGDIRRSHLALRQKVVGLQIRLMRDTGASAAQTLELSEMFRSQTLNEKLHRTAADKALSPALIQKRTLLQQQLQSK